MEQLLYVHLILESIERIDYQLSHLDYAIDLNT